VEKESRKRARTDQVEHGKAKCNEDGQTTADGPPSHADGRSSITSAEKGIGKKSSKIQSSNMIQNQLQRQHKSSPGTRRALPIPFSDCSARSHHVALPSFPNRPDDVYRGVFQAAPSDAAGSHFRPLINFDARSLSFPSRGAVRRPGRPARAMKHRCAASNDHVADPTTHARTTAKSPKGSMSVVARVDAIPSLSAFSAASFDTRNGGARLGFASMATRAGSFPTG
jgi:hypothetical protein